MFEDSLKESIRRLQSQKKFENHFKNNKNVGLIVINFLMLILIFLIECSHENALDFLNNRIRKLEVNQEVKQIQDFKYS